MHLQRAASKAASRVDEISDRNAQSPAADQRSWLRCSVNMNRQTDVTLANARIKGKY